MVRNSILLLTLFILSGCAVGQNLKLNHVPAEPGQAKKGVSAGVDVEDNRSYVVSGNKPEFFIGKYRAGLGNTWDVTTYQKIPLKDQIKSDLIEEIKNMGYDLDDTGNILSISIVDWNFDGYQNGKFWYELNVKVFGNDGGEKFSTTLKDKIIIKGTVMGGAKAGFERDMPGHYDAIINKILRNNSGVISALDS